MSSAKGSLSHSQSHLAAGGVRDETDRIEILASRPSRNQKMHSRARNFGYATPVVDEYFIVSFLQGKLYDKSTRRLSLALKIFTTRGIRSSLIGHSSVLIFYEFTFFQWPFFEKVCYIIPELPICYVVESTQIVDSSYL